LTKFLLNPFDEAERISNLRGKWIVATVNPRISWPTRKQIVEYDGIDFVLLPQSEKESAGVALRTDAHGLDAMEARKRIMRFCSALAWAEGAGIDIMVWGGGNLPRPIHVRHGRAIVDFLQTDHLPKPDTNEGRAAIALYREGVSLDNPFYAFLSLYKSISVILPKGKERAEWIDKSLGDLDERQAKERRDALTKSGIDVGQYIWEMGRNAIAHAEREPYVNPDEVDDHFRLYQDIPLIKNLAELAIEKRAGIPRSRTIWREHLYELQGFREVIPENILKMLEQTEPVPEGTTIEIPDRYTVLARRGAEVHAFENMKPEIVGQTQGGMAMEFVSDDLAIRFRVVLDFSAEKLIFDPIRGIGFLQDRNNKTRVQAEMGVLRFQRCILSNGRLEVWDPEKVIMLGRSETCIPVNCFVNTEFYDSELQTLSALLEKQPAPA
jgi:hypothetical protein